MSENLDTGKMDKYNTVVDLHSAFDLLYKRRLHFFLKLKSTHLHMTKYSTCCFFLKTENLTFDKTRVYFLVALVAIWLPILKIYLSPMHLQKPRTFNFTLSNGYESSLAFWISPYLSCAMRGPEECEHIFLGNDPVLKTERE